MNKISIVLVLFLLAGMATLETAVQKETIIVPDCTINRVPQIVIIESTIKPQSQEWSYFSEGYVNYLGQEMIANGYVTVDTFMGSCQAIP